MITLVTFGKKHGDYAGKLDRHFGCLKLPNPYHSPDLKPLTGKDRSVQAYVRPAADQIVEDAMNAIMKGKADPVIGFSCFGGRHRSVAVAELVAMRLSVLGIEYEVIHRDVK